MAVGSVQLNLSRWYYNALLTRSSVRAVTHFAY
jgi:hypothetical protein